jgi:hypothetical protein
MGQKAAAGRMTMRKGTMGTPDRAHGKITHTFQEMLSPALVRPRQFCRTLEPDKEFPLEVEKFVEIRKEKMYRVLVDDIRLR